MSTIVYFHSFNLNNSELKKYYFNFISNLASCSFIEKIYIYQNDNCFDNTNKINVTQFEKNFQERDTLNSLLLASKSLPSYDYVYFHSKSVTKPGNDEAKGCALTLLNFLHLVLINFDHIKLANYNAAGGNLISGIFEHFDSPEFAYSGNFWIAKGEYLKTIPILKTPKFSNYRHDAEFAISCGHGFAPFNLFSLYFHPESKEVLNEKLNPYLKFIIPSNITFENRIIFFEEYKARLFFIHNQLRKIFDRSFLFYPLLWSRLYMPSLYNVIERILFKFLPKRRKYFFIFHPSSLNEIK